MKVLLISGHGAGDCGATATISGTTYKEAEETIKVVNSIYDSLKRYASVEVYPTERNAFADLKAGSLKADFSKYDYVLEIHFNACVNDLVGDGKTTGTEIYIPSGGNGNLATAIVNNIAALGLKNRGLKSYDWSVIAKAKAAGAGAALAEICFIDDKDDMKVYTNKKRDIAEAITRAFVNTYKLKSNEEGEEEVKTEKIKIIVDGAEKTVEAVNIDGFNYIKARDAGEAMGYNVTYNSSKKAAEFSRQSL
ncbi:MAG: N-acetylmuramoyl-L-alanine amidase [Lachnospiraceae bacterium]|nr:N-acetylmuramoyl-L-alanine amidase [Lachnospiraceae bacterium]